MANRIETAAELVAKLLKKGKTEAEILAEHSGDEAIRAAIRDAKSAERTGVRTAGNAVSEATDFTRPITITPKPVATAPRVAPSVPAQPAVGKAARPALRRCACITRS